MEKDCSPSVSVFSVFELHNRTFDIDFFAMSIAIDYQNQERIESLSKQIAVWRRCERRQRTRKSALESGNCSGEFVHRLAPTARTARICWNAYMRELHFGFAVFIDELDNHLCRFPARLRACPCSPATGSRRFHRTCSQCKRADLAGLLLCRRR